MSVANMGRRSGHSLVLAALVLLALALCSAPIAYAQLNIVYVEGNVSNGSGNMVFGFSNDGAGNLTPLPGSPYLTGGFGVTGVFSDVQFDSDGELLSNAEASLLFAVNGSSNTISSFAINTDGSLTATSGSPFSSGGQDPVSLAVKENAYVSGDSLMVALNKNSDPLQFGGLPAYTTFDVTPSGSMTQNSGSTFNLATGTSPGQIITRPGSRVQFFGVEFMNSKVVTYKVSKTGVLSEVSEDNPGSVTLGGVAHPTRTGVYVALPGINQISVNKYDALGNLSVVKKVSNPGVLACWLTMNAGGTRLYSGETGSGSVTVYDTTNPNNPVQLQHFLLAIGSLPAHLKTDPTGSFLYVVDRGGSLHVLNIDVNGMLTETITPVNLGLPLGGIPMGLATVTK